MTDPLAILLIGPTASGKTGAAVELVQRLPLEIVSVDSAMIYRGMDIGTAKPDAAILRRAPHRLIDIRDPAERYSAAEFRDDALREMADIRRHGRTPLLVGGTTLYFRALEQGLSDLPPADPGVRARLEAEAAEFGWTFLHERLRRLDPQAAGRVPSPGWRFLKIILAPHDRNVLHRRIEIRFREMVAQGFLDEVRRLRARGDLRPDLPSMRAVGYRQAWACLEGNLSADEWIERGIIATRQYAKRQMTWLRSETGALWVDSQGGDSADSIMNLVIKSGAAAR